MTSFAPIEEEKRQLRAAMRAAIRSVSRADRHAHGLAVAERLRGSPLFHAARQVVAFASLESEIDTQPLLDCVHASGKVLLLPRVNGQGLDFVPVEADEALVTARLGVREPAADKAAAVPAAGSLVLTPGLAFDRHGGRLGRGAGYYDRALAALRRESIPVRVVGVGYALQIVERIPMSSHDERLDGILTEEAFLLLEDAGA